MAVHYKLKAIKFLERDVPVVIQNENGPCPLIALANVLLLRNQIHVSVDCPEVSQERLLALIAGFLLDSNNPERLGSSDADLQANLQKNMGDAVEMLPKLTTGLDVNIFFHNIMGFEFTDVVAIFDLLDIQLVHGWLVDPQDKDTVACIGNRSYNALIERLVSLTGQSAADSTAAPGDQTTAHPVPSTPAPDSTPQPIESDKPARSTGAEATPAADSATEPEPIEASEGAQEDSTPTNEPHKMDILGSEYDAELQAALCLSISQPATNTSPQAQQAQQEHLLDMDEAPRSVVVTSVEAARAEAETSNVAADGAALAEDYVVISHPEGAVLNKEMADPSAAQMLPGATADPAHPSPHNGASAANVTEDSQASDSSGPAQALDVISSDGHVVGAMTPEQVPGQAHLAAAMLAGCARFAFPGPSAEGTAAGSTAATPDMPAKSNPDAAENAIDDRSAETVQAAQAAPAGGQVAPAEGTVPEKATLSEGTAPEQVAPSEGIAPEQATPAEMDPPGGSPGGRPGKAYVIQAFLDNTSSQLTEHGLVSLHAGLKPNQLAVLFRNNHFNTLFKYEDALYILVTDLGYLHEKEVVWEKLDAIDGDTVFVTSTLKPPEPVRTTEQANADYALALQLHQEEQEAAERRRLSAAAADAPQPPAPSGQPVQPGPPGPAQQDAGGRHRRHHGRHQRPHSGSRPSRPKQDNCSMM